ncbi:photosynthetic complex assembly protein PuhC [Rhodopseudomonas sp. B29]|uniref:photosynthetic complex assembly protein PuhC n=1 Tax=Rhodopseudomonas sp. B29 TaxID=95607 RepID=UPI000346D239|nr:photosynthetic complex assembly protein PuhC [Rhodopseudomonas sp. B29]
MSEAAHNLNVPKGALIAAAAVVLFTIAAATTTRLTGIGYSHMTPPAMVESLDLTFEDSPDGAVLIYTAGDHKLIRTVHPGESGFVRVVMRGMARERQLAGIGQAVPFRLARYVNGQYTMTDLATKKVVDLSAFGADNRRAFAQLMPAEATNEANAATTKTNDKDGSQ